MTIKSAPFYWITCDHDGCAGRCPPEGHEYSAWSDPGQAIDCARDSEWFVEDGKHLCFDHWPHDDDDDEPAPIEPSQ